MENVTALDVAKTDTMRTHGFEPMNEAVWAAWVAKNKIQEAQGLKSRFNIIKCLCIGVLIAAAILTPSVGASYLLTYESFVRFVTCFGAVAMVFESFSIRRYAFTAFFAGTLLLFNPIFPVFGLTGSALILLATAVLFFGSLVRMKRSLR